MDENYIKACKDTPDIRSKYLSVFIGENRDVVAGMIDMMAEVMKRKLGVETGAEPSVATEMWCSMEAVRQISTQLTHPSINQADGLGLYRGVDTDPDAIYGEVINFVTLMQYHAKGVNIRPPLLLSDLGKRFCKTYNHPSTVSLTAMMKDVVGHMLRTPQFWVPVLRKRDLVTYIDDIFNILLRNKEIEESCVHTQRMRESVKTFLRVVKGPGCSYDAYFGFCKKRGLTPASFDTFMGEVNAGRSVNHIVY